MTRHRRLTSLALLVALIGTIFATSLSASAKAPAAAGSLDVTGVVAGDGIFVGTIADLSFSANLDGTLAVSGRLAGAVTVGDEVTAVIDQRFTTAVTVLDGSGCDLLRLELDPIFVAALGLDVQLAEVRVIVEGGGGGLFGLGNLLGDLTCAVADLVDDPDSNRQLARLLNRIVNTLD